MALKIIDSKITEPSPLVTKNKPTKNICKIYFDNKTIENINTSCIFHDPLVVAALPNTFAHFGTPTVVYTLMDLVESKIFNLLNFYPKFLNV